MAEMSRDNARKIEFYGSTLEECVNALLKFQNRGESVVVDFNGHQLYSCDVTMDSAYLEVCGQTKAEFDKAQEEWRENYRKEEEEAKAKAEAKVPDWIKRGERFIYPERAEEWKKCVEERAGDLYHGMDLDAAIEIMEKLESGATLDEAKELIDSQGHSGMSYGMVRNIVFSFSKYGPEFWEHTAYGEISPKNKMAIADKKKENAELEALHNPKEGSKEKEADDPYKELKVSANEVGINYKYGNTIESAVRTLQEYKERGESVFIEFNGHKLYSCDVTMDSAYQEITGKTKAEFDKAREEWLKEYEEREAREKSEAKAKIPAWIERGSAYIYPEKMEQWAQCVETRAGDLYHGMDLDSVLELMEKLESGASMEEVKEIFDGQGHSGASAGMVRSMMFHFAKRGPEFYESTAWRELSDEDKKAIADKKKENAELDELHKDDSTKEISVERRTEEQEITNSSAEKEQLTSEISDIEQQLAALRAKEAELKKALGEKQSQLNGLEEK